MEPYGIIYLLFNKIEHKSYVGLTTGTLETRSASHKGSRDTNTKLGIAIRDRGWDSFHKTTIDIGFNKQDLNRLEKFYIDYYDTIINGYNMMTGGGAGGTHSDDTKKKLSDSLCEHFADPKNRDRQRVAAIRQFSDPEQRRRNRVAQTIAHNSPQSLALSRKLAKKQFSNYENRDKQRIASSKQMKPIVCNETNELFESANSAARAMNLDAGNISLQVRGKVRHVKGFTFRYAIRVI